MAEMKARDGRKALVYIGKVASEKASGALLAGHWYAITKKAEAGTTKFGNLEVGHMLYVSKSASITPAEGDECVKVDLLFLGSSTSKQLTESKSTSDVTCDKDDSANYVTNGVVSSSGSISGYDLLDPNVESGINYVRAMFNDVVTYGPDGTPTLKSVDKTEKTLLFFMWDARDAEEGESVGVDVLPAYLTEKSRDSSYGSPQSMNLNFQGCDSDEHGIKRHYQEIVWTEPAPAA